MKKGNDLNRFNVNSLNRMKKRGKTALLKIKLFSIIVSAVFILLFSAAFVSATISCDSGDQATTCTISAPKEYGNGDIFDAKNLVIATGGSIYNYTLNSSRNNGARLIINLTGNLTISSGANITGGNLTINSLNNITILAGGKIITSELGTNASATSFSVSGLGTGKGTGTGENDGAGGAGYGGSGGAAVKKQFTGGLSYGNHTHPVDFGSSGGNGNAGRGGRGGGIIKLNASLILIEGQILANGQAGGTATNNAGGGGSGGSILLITDTISGDGNITANGGAGGSNGASLGGGGSGGRVAIHATTYSLTGPLSTFGGSSTGNAEIGAPGTIYKNVNSQTYGDLIISNNNVIPGERSKSNTREIGARLPSGVWIFDTINISASGALEIHNTTVVLNLTQPTILGDLSGTIINRGNISLNSSYDFSLFNLSTYAGSYTFHLANLTTNATIAIANGSNIPSLYRVVVKNQGILTHPNNNDSVPSHRLDLVLTNLTILPGGRINVNSLGYNASNSLSNGPGKGTSSSSNIAAGGASHGGAGGNGTGTNGNGVTYGNHTHPIDIGSSGGSGSSGFGGAGGGAVKINATFVDIQGQILANGIIGHDATTGSGTGGGGSGGSIWIISTYISKTGNLSANGGNGADGSGTTDSGGGSGGRISIWYIANFSSLNSSVSFLGGTGPGTATDGGNGTFYLENLDGIAPVVVLSLIANATNTSRANIIFNFTGTDNLATELTCTLYIDGNSRNSNSSSLNNTLTNLNLTTSSFSDGEKIWNVNCTDGAGNQNTSEFRTFTLDLTPPNLANISFSPNVTDILDPDINVTWNITLRDSLFNISSAILQLHNSTSWTNYTMYSLQQQNKFQANVSLIKGNANYSYLIWSNDTLGNSNATSNTTLESSWDCSWLATPNQFEEKTGYFESKGLGNFTLNNTGDAGYGIGNCTVKFDFDDIGSTYSSDYLIATFATGSAVGMTFSNDSLVLSAKNNASVGISVGFPQVSSPLQETPKIKITANITNSITNNLTINLSTTLVVTPPGPYLFQAITSSPSSVYLTPGNFSLESYVRDLTGNDSDVNIAYNVTFNWSLPSTLSSLLTTGNSSMQFGNLSNSSKQESNLTLVFTSTNLEDLNQSTFEVFIYSSAYNSSANIVTHAGNLTTLVDSKNVSFLCYTVADSVCVEACGSTLDPDCATPTVSVDSGSSTNSGGGGGGGGGSGSGGVVTKADYQITRGKTNEIIVDFQNKHENRSLTNIQFTLTGDLAKYMEVKPQTVSSLGPRETINLKILITSPTYLPLGKKTIYLEAVGNYGTQIYREKKIIVLEINDLTEQEALDLVNKAEKLINEFNLAGFNSSSIDLENNLEEAKQALKDLDYEIVKSKTSEIITTVENALESKKITQELALLIKHAKNKGIDVSGSERLLNLAVLALNRNEFARALERAKESQVSYALEVKGELGTISYYVKEYPAEISLSTLFLILFVFVTYRVGRLGLINVKISKLKEDEKILNELIKVVQSDTFKAKKMSMEEYGQTMRHYEKRMAEVIEQLIELETKRAHALKFTSKEKQLKLERIRVLDLIKELQFNYLRRGTIETRSYELKLQSYHKRLGEIDESIATREVQEQFKSTWKGLSEIPKLFGRKAM